MSGTRFLKIQASRTERQCVVTFCYRVAQFLLPGSGILLPGSSMLLGTASPSERPVSREKKSPGESIFVGLIPLLCKRPPFGGRVGKMAAEGNTFVMTLLVWGTLGGIGGSEG